jgi:hypothetical protein
MTPLRHDLFPAHYVFALLGCYAELIGSYRRFGVGYAETPATNYNSTLSNILEERRPHLNSGGSQKLRQYKKFRDATTHVLAFHSRVKGSFPGRWAQ